MDAELQNTLEKQADLITNIIMRISALEKVLLDKNVVTAEEITKELNTIGEQIIEAIKKTASERNTQD
jgi:hypothetical protein